MFSERRLSWAGDLWESSGGRTMLIAADGCVDLIWRDGQLFVSGPTTAPFQTDGGSGRSVGLRLRPGLGGLLLGLPLAELRDRCVPLAGVLGPTPTLVEDAPLTGLPTVLDAALASADRVTLTVWRQLLAHADAGTPAAQAADAIGLSERQLRREHQTLFGFSYRTSRRIRRAQRAMAALSGGRPAAEVAAGGGFADQPHLTRELKALTGRTPGQLAGSIA